MIFPIDATIEMQESFFVEEYGGISVSDFSDIACGPVPFEGDDIGPPIPARNISRLDLHLKTDPKLGAPARNSCKQSVSLHNS